MKLITRKGTFKIWHARRSEAVPKTIVTRVCHAVTWCTLSFPFGEAHSVRVCVVYYVFPRF